MLYGVDEGGRGVGLKLIINFYFLFLAPPEITVEKSWVHAGEGYESHLVCTVHGEANPVVSLYLLVTKYGKSTLQ